MNYGNYLIHVQGFKMHWNSRRKPLAEAHGKNNVEMRCCVEKELGKTILKACIVFPDLQSLN
jgi:hypothetical protein